MAGDVRAFDRMEIHQDVQKMGSIKGISALQSPND
jgi:hypothetical protein